MSGMGLPKSDALRLAEGYAPSRYPVLDGAKASPHLCDMFSVEVSYRTDHGELLSERTNIPCASTCDDAQRIVREWLAARCPILQRAVLATLFDGEKHVSSLSFDDRET